MDGNRSENVEMITQAYLKTLVWNFHYYFGSSGGGSGSASGAGGCISWDWAYTFPYAPCWHDIYNELVKHKNIKMKTP